MALDVAGIMDGIVSPMLSSGEFDRVNTSEPKTAPGSGLTGAVWLQRVAPAPTESGLAMTSGLVVFMIRLYTSMLAEPQDMIDPEMLRVTALLVGLFSGDFTLGGSVKNVDLLGANGTPFETNAGYINQDGRLMRVMDITLPLIVNDVWTQAP